MALGKRKTGGDFLPIVKWDARIGTVYLEDRVYAKGSWEKRQRNIAADKFRAVFDVENAQRGWIDFSRGAPDMKLVRAGQDPGEPPSDTHKEGIRLVIKMDESLGGDVRELISTAVTMWIAVDELHDAYLAGIANHPGSLPAVDIAEVREEKTKAATLFAPVFKIVGWVPRPPELPAGGVPPATRKAKTVADDFAHDDTASDFARPTVRDALSDEIPF